MNRWLSHVSEGVTLNRIMSGCNGTKVGGGESHPTWFAPSGSNQSSSGGNETAEASGAEGR